MAKRFQRRRFFRNQPIRDKNCLWRPCLLTDRDEISNLYRGLPKMLPTKLRFTWQNGFRGEEFKKSANQKQESSVVAMFVNGSERNEQSLQRTFHRCFLKGFGSFGQAVSEEKIYKNRPIRNKNFLWRQCLLMDWDEMCKLSKGPSIDASYQVSVHLAKGFQRRRLKCEKLTDVGRRTPSDGKSSHCLWQGELKMNKKRIKL